MANKTKIANAVQAQVGQVDWQAEAHRAVQAAKDKPGSRGNLLAKVAGILLDPSPKGDVLRAGCGEAGAQRIIEAPRNVLAKLDKLCSKVAAGTPWCTAADLLPENRRQADASIAIALGAHGAGNERQKAIVAHAMGRYPGGANAQMPAAMDALRVVGIVAKADGSGARNASYVIVDQARAARLIPTD